MPRIRGFDLEIEGTKLSTELLALLSEVEVLARTGRPASFILRFEPGSSARLLKGVDGILVDTVAPGRELKILLGGGRQRELLRGRIDGVGLELDSQDDSAAAFVARGHDHGFRLTQRQSVRTFENLPVSEIALQIAGEHGLEAKVDDSPVRSRVVQSGQTDWDLLVRLAAESDRHLRVEGDTLVFEKAGSADHVGLTWGRGLVSFQPKLAASAQVSEVTVRGWDPDSKQAVEGTHIADPKEPDGSVREVRGRVVRSKAEAERIAESVARLATQSVRRARGELRPGLAGLRIGNDVSVKGVGKKFAGSYRVSSVVHRITPVDGFVTLWEAGTVEVLDPLPTDDPVASAPPGCCGQPSVAVAVVIDNEHPEPGQAGVRVSFPWLSESDQSGWLRVATPMAGHERGLYLLPEVGDEVLVAFEHGDLQHPFVIGSLWNGVDRPPETNDNGNNDIRVLDSRSGHRIVFDDTAGAEKIQIEDGDGANLITLDAAEQELLIESHGDLRLKAHGDLVLEGAEIRMTGSGGVEAEAGAAIELNATNVELNATANATVKGGATAKLDGGTQTIVEGPLVKIN